MLDPFQFRFNVSGSHHVAVREMPKVQLDPRLEAPLQGNLINRYRPLFSPACSFMVG